MKNQLEHEDLLLRKFISEAGSENPPSNFHLKILSKIETKSRTAYQPILSPLAIKAILLGILSIAVLTIIFIPGQENSLSLLDQLSNTTVTKLNLQLPKINLPIIHMGPVFNIALLAFSLLMIPWIIYQSKRLKVG
ncbi:hypothetical protein JYB64_18135 [Algoriphagus aestuarii]|nr:hypothetical protein [Algoriphagus aestuarii]